MDTTGMKNLGVILNRNIPRANQKGYTLLLGLIMILVLTVFGVFALNGSMMQARMAGNYRDAQYAFEASELGLRWGEAWLQSRTPLQRPFPCQAVGNLASCVAPNSVLDANMIPFNVEAEDIFGTSTWTTVSLNYGVDPENGLVLAGFTVPDYPGATQPFLLLEQAFVDRDDLAGNPQQGRVFYRVMAAAHGRRLTTTSVLESSVAKRFD